MLINALHVRETRFFLYRALHRVAGEYAAAVDVDRSTGLPKSTCKIDA